MQSDVPKVLIVGAGPSGLMSALVLARFGIPLRIIEKEAKKSPYSRAIAVQTRTLEIFEALGLLPHLQQKSASIERFVITTESLHPISFAPVVANSRFSRPLIVDQPHTEEVLEAALKALGVEVERGVTLEKITQNNSLVTAYVKEVDQKISEKIYSYVIGADGAHSTVRKQMHNSFLGESYEDAFILADVIVETTMPQDAIKLFFKGPKFLALIPMFGHNHYRLISVRHNERSKEGPAPSMAEFQALLQSICPVKIRIESCEWVSRFFVQCRSALHYQEGPVFLVGDAAHIHSPAGGQGMNTGLQDALNLCFKLAMVLKKEALPSLLLSYEEERKPVGEFLLKYTDRLFRFMVRASFFARVLRTIFLPRILASKERQARFFRIGSQVAIRYKNGFVCKKNHALYVPNFIIGARVPDVSLIDSRVQKISLHTLVIKHFFNVVLFMPANIARSEAKKFLRNAYELEKELALKVHVVFANDYDAEKVILEEEYSVLVDDEFLKPQDEPFYLAIRADQHLFCYGFLDDFDHLSEELRKFIARREP